VIANGRVLDGGVRTRPESFDAREVTPFVKFL
jgi:hypothetical protein